uniref:RING-type domain-containing protein n=1 Tax=Sinocyclocheilus anshuiensis TaxID=1608454 RepID=A0A671P5W3_9TELE
MAEASISWAEDQFCCPVCLDLLNDPVTIHCGHSYCKSCITNCKNVVLAKMVEKMKKTRLQPAAPAVHHTGPGDVQCDSCTGIKQKAVKLCLDCQSSYCQNHLEQHESLFRGRKHNLMDATGQLQEMICPRHDKMLEMYCRTDQQSARTEKQRHVVEKKRNFQKIIQQKVKDLQELREAVESLKRSAQTVVEDSERIFTDFVRSIEKRRSEVMLLISDQERAAVSRAEEQLATEADLKQLSETDDHIHFLQSLRSIPGLTGLAVNCHLSFDAVVKTAFQLRDKLHQFSRETIKNISGTVKTIQIIGIPEYQNRKEFLRCEIYIVHEPYLTFVTQQVILFYHKFKAFSQQKKNTLICYCL